MRGMKWAESCFRSHICTCQGLFPMSSTVPFGWVQEGTFLGFFHISIVKSCGCFPWIRKRTANSLHPSLGEPSTVSFVASQELDWSTESSFPHNNERKGAFASRYAGFPLLTLVHYICLVLLNHSRTFSLWKSSKYATVIQDIFRRAVLLPVWNSSHCADRIITFIWHCFTSTVKNVGMVYVHGNVCLL